VYVSDLVPPEKVEALQAFGAELVVYGASQDEAGERAAQRCAADGLTMVHPFDDRDVIAGQGTWPQYSCRSVVADSLAELPLR
jgi:threonine dehydratase